MEDKVLENYSIEEVFKGFQGVDVSLEVSLLEYGLIWTDQTEDCEEDELFFIAKISDNFYETGYVSHDTLDFVEDEEGFFKFLGESKEEWLNKDLGMKVYDVVNYFGAQELFYSYYKITTLEDLIKMYTNEEE